MILAMAQSEQRERNARFLGIFIFAENALNNIFALVHNSLLFYVKTKDSTSE